MKNFWHIQIGEPQNWFSRFTRFRLLGASRSLLAAVNSERVEKGRQKTNDSPGSWRRAAKQWNWLERAEAWDRMKNAEQEQIWEERRRQLRQQQWEVATALHHKATQMLQISLEEARWTLRDAAAFLELSSTLGRQSTGLDNDSMFLKQQLSILYGLLKELLTLEDSATATTVKDLIRTSLDTILLQLGKPVREVTSVLSLETDETDFEIDDESDC